MIRESILPYFYCQDFLFLSIRIIGEIFGGRILENLLKVSDILFEHRFWLQILGDHSRFILNELSPTETEEIQGARFFMGTFDKLLERARQNLSEREILELTENALKAAQEFRVFKLSLLRQHLVGNIKLGLPPTFINHMLNELDEYLRILMCFKEKKGHNLHALHHHLLWLLDGAGHAASIQNMLDEVERKYILKAREFNKDFKDLYIKAVEFSRYLRTNLNKFPALDSFNVEVKLQMNMFMEFLAELEELRLKKKVLGTLMPIMADHMLREECYFLTKLSMVTDMAKPDCDPAKQRLES